MVPYITNWHIKSFPLKKVNYTLQINSEVPGAKISIKY